MRMNRHGEAKGKRLHFSSFYREIVFLSYLTVRLHLGFPVAVSVNVSSLSLTVFCASLNRSIFLESNGVRVIGFLSPWMVRAFLPLHSCSAPVSQQSYTIPVNSAPVA